MLLINIQHLWQVRDANITQVPGNQMNDLPKMDNAWLWIENGSIRDFGSMDQRPNYNGKTLDCEGKMVLPSFVDSHTHIVFAEPREEEFVMRIEGRGYEEIAAAGGGILNSAKKLQGTSEDALFASAWDRLQKLMKTGTGAIEVKSGYGLSVEAELKMLRVIRRLKEAAPIPVKATFLGAHAFPAAFKENHQGYLDLLINEMLPQIAVEGLADYVDAFCERGYYSVEETKQLLKAAEKHGLKAKIHVNQFSKSGGVQLGVEMGALSVDHLEAVGEEEIACLKGSSTIPTLLPSCSFFLNIPYGPARELMKADLPLALATDFNPGSTPSGNMPFLLSLACIKLRMTPYEAINAMTLNAAAAVEMGQEIGSITKGKRANLLVLKDMPSLAYWPYAFGEGNQMIEHVLVNGELL